MKIVIEAPQMDRFIAALLTAPEILRSEMLTTEKALLASGIGFTQEAAPLADGGLRGSIGVIEEAHWTGGGVSGSYGTSLIYAAQRNFGGPIFAKPGGWLVFEVDGETVFAKKVEQEGSHFMEKGAEQVEPLVAEAFERALDRVFAAIGA